MTDNSEVSPVTVKVSRIGPHSRALLPQRMTDGAAGFDLSAAIGQAIDLNPGEISVIPCGFAMAIPTGYEAQVRPRSGLASKFGVTLINSPGTIDSDYRGEVCVPLINHGKAVFTIEPNMRIAQMLILPVPTVRLMEVDTLDGTARGSKGFGHTGH